MKLKHILSLLVVACIASIIYGYSLDVAEKATADKFKGFGTLALFLVAMPLFLYKESKSRKWEDYMLNEDNVRKMQGKPPKEKEKE